MGVTPLVWRVYAGGLERSDDTPARASAQDWEVATVRCVRLRSGSGRRAYVLGRNDAAQIYEDIHRRPVAVIYDRKPLVRTSPMPPFQDNQTVTLFQFVRYKCFAMNLAHNAAHRWESDFREWLQRARCDGRNDPRILPLHIFAMKGEYDLNRQPDRQQFRRSHRQQRDRTLVDRRKRRWSPPRSGASHGREPQTVRGLRLDDGYHWDVTTRKSPVVASVNMIWNVPRGEYVNIYPDGYIRRGGRSKQVWSHQQSARADREERR